MKDSINIYLGLVFKVGLVAVILTSLFLFTNLTTEFYDTSKFLVLLVFVGFLIILLTLKYTLSGRVVFVRTALDLPLLLLLVVAIVSTVLAPAPYLSLLGNQLRVHGSLISLVVYILFYFLLVNNLRSSKDIKWALYISLAGGALLSTVSLLAYFGMKILPSPWTHGTNFTTTGLSFSTTAVLAMFVPILLVMILSQKNTSIKSVPIKLISIILLTLFGITIALTGSLATWAATVLGLLIVLWVNKNHIKFTPLGLTKLVGVIVPVVLVLLVVVLSFVPPIGGASNPLYTQAKNFPREIQLNFPTSWKVAVSSFRDMPFWGTGPSTFLFDFTNYKPIEFNASKFWNLRYDSAFNEYLQVLATLGGIGLLALLSLTAIFVNSAYRSLYSSYKTSYESLTPTSELRTGLAISGLLFFIILALHSGTLVVWVIGLLILASYMVTNLLTESASRPSYSGNALKQVFMRLAAFSNSQASQETVRVDALPGVLLVIALTLTLTSLFFAGKLVLADYHHRLALNAVAQNQGVVAYNELVAAEKLNPINDLYRTDLAQVNFALANAIALAKAPTEASPSGSLTDQDKQNIQVLLQQSINEGRTAVALSPRSTINWEILGSLYRQISGVAQNALIFSLDSYGRAIFQDPLNPLLRLNVGGTYYAIRNYDLAIRFFTDAINLKPDFANGYYNLSVALRDKGDLNGALQAAERTLQLVDPASPDYKVASDYVNDLKNKINPPAPATPPAATTSGALQNQELPKVVNVGNPPEKIATPTAVKKPNSTPEPTPTP